MASKRHQRRRACESKIAYEERWQAVQSLKRLGSGYSGGTYRCEFCGKWHIGRVKRRYLVIRQNR